MDSPKNFFENILNLAEHLNYFLNYQIIPMAKSIKKTSKKTAKKAVKKAPVKSVKKAAKKVIIKKIAKKAVKKAVKKVVGKSATKPVHRSGKRFLVIYHVPMDALEQTTNATPEQQAAGMVLWNTWAERMGSKLTDLGAALINGKRLTAEGSLTPSTKEVAGYSLLQAEDLEELMGLLQSNPHLSGWHPEATVEVHELMIMPGM
jgi:hypothetical protein